MKCMLIWVNFESAKMLNLNLIMKFILHQFEITWAVLYIKDSNQWTLALSMSVCYALIIDLEYF